MSELRVLCVGQGLIGRQRADALLALADDLPVRLAGTVDPVADARPGIPHFASLDAVAASTYDAAVIAVPHDLARPIATEILGSGRPVLLEKPLGITSEEAREIHDLALTIDQPSFVGYNYRFLPTLQAAFAAISDGRVGRLRTIDMLLGHGGHPGSAKGWKLLPERAGGGVLIDPGVHLLDLLLCLAPDIRCTHVDATRGFWKTGIEEDVISSFARDGLLATVRVSHIRWINTFRIEIGGDDGYVIIDGRGGNYGAQTVRIGARWGWQGTDLAQRDTEEQHDFGSENRSLDEELRAVVELWLDNPAQPGQPHPATMNEALRVAELCTEMYGRLSVGPSSHA